MKRLITLLLAFIMATLPPSLLMVVIGGLAPTAGVSGGTCVRGAVVMVEAASPGFPGVMMGAVASGSFSSSATISMASMASMTLMASGDFDGGGGSSSSFSPPPPRATGETYQSSSPETLKVSVLGLSRGISPSCTYSLVEFMNAVSFSMVACQGRQTTTKPFLGFCFSIISQFMLPHGHFFCHSFNEIAPDGRHRHPLRPHRTLRRLSQRPWSGLQPAIAIRLRLSNRQRVARAAGIHGHDPRINIPSLAKTP